MIDQSASQIRFSWHSLLLVSVLPFLSGAAALSHELLWTRRLIDLLGATDWVVGRVLGLFFLGISLGGYLATFQTRSKIPPIYKLAIAELCIALLSLGAAFLPLWTDWIWSVLGTELLVAWQGSLIKLGITILVVVPPSIAMGLTLPFFIRVATELGGKVSSAGIWIYGLNTIGGVAGLWLTSTWLIQNCGAQWTMILIALVNLLVAITVSVLARNFDAQVSNTRHLNKKKKKNREKQQPDSTSSSGQPANPMATWKLVLLSMISGFVILAFEVLLFRLISLVLPSSYHTTSAMLANVIVFLAISSVLVSLLNSVGGLRTVFNNRLLVGIGFWGGALFIGLCPIFLYQWTNELVSIRYIQSIDGGKIESINHYWQLVFWLVAAAGGLALFFSGFVFPSLMSISSESDNKGERIGLLLAANGIGGLLGSELSNSLLIGSVGVYPAFSILALIGLVAGGAMVFGSQKLLSISVSVVVAMVVFLGFTQNRSLPYFSPKSTAKFKVEETHFGRDGVMLVVEDEKKSRSILVNGQYILGSSGVAQDQRRQLLLPWLLNPSVDSVCCLGLATGISAGGLEQVDSPPSVTAVELSANVERLARKHFSNEANGFFDRKENRVVIEDARTYMAASKDQFDLIVGDLYRPHGTGEGRLYTLEHFRNVRDALKENGVYCQWLPAYQLNSESWQTIAATFQRVFPHTLVMYGNQDTRYPVIGLLGRKNSQQWDSAEIDKRLEAIPANLIEQDPLLGSAKGLIVGVLKPDQFDERTPNTLDNLQIEIEAGNFWILKDLRSKRQSTFETEFLKGRNLVEFNKLLLKQTTPVLDREFFLEFQKSLFADEKSNQQK